MKLILHNSQLIENVWREPLLLISKVTTLLSLLLHSLSRPSTPRQMFGSPQRSHFSETSLPLYEGFEILRENMCRIIFIRFFKR